MQEQLSFVIHPPYCKVESILQLINKDATEFNNRHKNRRLVIHELNKSVVDATLWINPRDTLNFSEVKLSAHGINSKMFIGVEIQLYLQRILVGVDDIHESSVNVHAFQCGDVETNRYDANEKHFFPLSRLIEVTTKNALLRRLLPCVYDSNSDCIGNRFQDLLELIEDTIKRANRLCIMSGKRIDSSFRPRMENSYTSFAQAITSGFGERLLKWYVQHEEHLMQYILSTATAGNTLDYVSYVQHPLFYIVESDGRLTPFHEDAERLIAALIAVPPVQDIRKFIEDGSLKDRLDAENPASYGALLAIFLTNPVYLHETTVYKNLSSKVRQYILLCSSISVEKQFQQLKNQRPSNYGIATMDTLVNAKHLTGPYCAYYFQRCNYSFSTSVASFLKGMESEGPSYALVLESCSRHQRGSQPRVLLLAQTFAELKGMKLEETSTVDYLQYFT